MKLIVALGNVGKEYDKTRHNIGFMVVDSFYNNFHLEKKFQAYIGEDSYEHEKYLLIKPITMMNLSGISVAKVVNFYHIDPQDILVIQDDMDLPLGSYKLKRNSSSGGHNGIKSIISSLQTESFLRLKVGIGKSRGDTIDWVLGKFSKGELETINSNLSTYQQIIYNFVKYGTEDTLQKFSKKR